MATKTVTRKPGRSATATKTGTRKPGKSTTATRAGRPGQKDRQIRGGSQQHGQEGRSDDDEECRRPDQGGGEFNCRLEPFRIDCCQWGHHRSAPGPEPGGTKRGAAAAGTKEAQEGRRGHETAVKERRRDIEQLTSDLAAIKKTRESATAKLQMADTAAVEHAASAT